MDETEYLLPLPTNAERLKHSLEQVKNKKVPKHELLKINDNENQSPESSSY